MSEEDVKIFAVGTAAAALEALTGGRFDCAIVDLGLPDQDGLEFLRGLRGRGNSVPILITSARYGLNDRVTGLNQGADDYLAKPFEPRELVLRINSILRRMPRPAADPVSTTARLGTVVFDMVRDELSRDGQPIPLTSGEQRLLHMLAERPGIVFSREDLARILTPGGGERAIDVQVTRLRRKIEPDPKMPRYLQTVRGQGYILRPD